MMNAYKKLCTEFYDIDKPEAPRDALDFYLKCAGRAGGPILEAMCGSGRFLVPMLERGFDVDGVDASPHMLGACREKCAARGLNPRLREQLLHELDLPRKYPLVFIAAGSFNLITDLNQVRESLRRIRNVMLPDAKLVLETGQHKPKESSSWPWGGRWITRPDGAKIIISWLGSYDARTSISKSVNRYDLIKDGRLLETEFEDFDLRRYDLAELCALLEAAGFGPARTFKTFDFAPPPETEDEVIVECSAV
jgi:SAM-dependent methyltransferase